MMSLQKGWSCRRQEPAGPRSCTRGNHRLGRDEPVDMPIRSSISKRTEADTLAARALPELIEPVTQPLVPVCPLGSNEALVQVQHPRIATLESYWSDGWASAQRGCFVREGVLERLEAAVRSLPASYGLAVFDAWRPLELQQELFQEAYLDPELPEGFVEMPSADPATPPPHLTGGAVDVTLTFNGHTLYLGTEFDAFCDDARTGAFEDTPNWVQAARRVLFWTMHDAGFVVADNEWWHYEFGTRRWGAIRGLEPLYGPAAR